MKPVVALDLSLFAIPNTADSKEEVQEILESIQAWASIIDRQNCVTFATLTDAVDTLREANCFPATQHIRALLQLYELEHVFSANDINTRLFSILQKAQRLSEIVGLEVIELEFSDIDGADTAKSPDIAILRSLACLVASIALCNSSDIIRVSTAFPCDDSIEIKGRVRLREAGGRLERIEVEVNGAVRAISKPNDFLPSLAADKVWQCADDEIQLHLAISLEVAAAAGLELNSIPLSGVPGFCIGSDFLSSLQQNGAVSDCTLANVVRAKCGQVLISKPQAAPKRFHQCRTGDNAESFRVHLSKDHEAFRLMYWIRPDGEIEFANIGPKKELAICEGDYRGHLASRYC